MSSSTPRLLTVVVGPLSLLPLCFCQGEQHDFYGERSEPIVCRRNDGQLIGTNGLVAATVSYYTEGTLPRVYMMRESLLKYA